jgi:hypothetical protein
MSIIWPDIVTYTAIILMPILIYRLFFVIKDPTDHRFGQTSFFILALGIIESALWMFSIGWIIAVAIVLIGMLLLLINKTFQTSLFIAVLTESFALIVFFKGIQIFMYFFLLGCCACLASFITEFTKYRKELKQLE